MGQLLDKINNPKDLRSLPMSQLKDLALEVREFILDSLSKTGGHLASNLGAVELTLALHYVFDFSQDKLLWDVGHQCYPHKIITGRRDQFGRLRQVGGISGFPNPAESEFDQFCVGHAGTAIPTAIGLALGEQIRQQQLTDPAQSKSAPNIVALVGDASIVNGCSFEGLNNLGLVKRQMLIVLNDNDMAIDSTVGALAKCFSRLRLSHTYEDVRKTTKSILEHVPKIGRSMDEAMERVKKSIRMVLPPSQMFESLNIPYFGPVDGHNVESLVQLFRALSEINHPVLLHAYTKKGKGFSPARSGPSKFHSTGPFQINGDAVEPQPKATQSNFTTVFGQHITQLAEQDERIIAMTSAMCDGTGLGIFKEKFPQRFYDVGIAESAAVDIAAGLAHSGFRPIVCIYSTFLQRSFDQIFQEVALQNLPVIFCVDRAGYVGPDGATHHGIMDIGYLRMMPNLILTAPANEPEIKLALEFALQQDHPVVIRYPKDQVAPAASVHSACNSPFELGQAITVKSETQAEIVIVNYGCLLDEALQAEQDLAQEGIKASVINARFAAPVDESIITLLDQGKKIITLEDHGLACGFGSAVLELAATSKLRRIPANAIRILGAPRVFMEQNLRKQQLMQAGLNADTIVNTAREMLSV
jgi:1-deoxy-D-xylulose-5-phosphate synthase